jgi:hypothetical protein
MNRLTAIAGALLAAAFTAFIGWRMVYPPKYIDVSDWFATPIATTGAAQPSFDISAQACGACHTDHAREWAQTMHAHVWDDPAFQADWRVEGGSPICLNCHTPLDRQQENLVIGSTGGDPWRPALAPNPTFDASLRDQGVTCAACHVRDGKIFGPWPSLDAPHPTAAWASPNESCIRCHLAANTSKTSFLSKPPCGTIAEIEPARAPGATAPTPSADGYLTAPPISHPAALGCVECHMPSVERALTPGGPARPSRRHLWLGGHDRATVRSALTIDFAKTDAPSGATHVALTLANTGANHFVPTGPADRHLTVKLQALDAENHPVQTQEFMLGRTVLGRPFLIDLQDTRLQPNKPQTFVMTVPTAAKAVAVEATVRYWLMSNSHREKLAFTLPISDEIFRERIPVVSAAAK